MVCGGGFCEDSLVNALGALALVGLSMSMGVGISFVVFWDSSIRARRCVAKPSTIDGWRLSLGLAKWLPILRFEAYQALVWRDGGTVLVWDGTRLPSGV